MCVFMCVYVFACICVYEYKFFVYLCVYVCVWVRISFCIGVS